MKKQLIFFTLLLIFASCGSNTSSSDSVDSVINNGNRCAVISEDFVKQKVKYPDETNFTTSSYVHELDNGIPVILNRFTTKNAFGVTITCTYKIWLNFKGGDWSDINNWSYYKLIIEGSDGSKMEY